MAFFVYVIKAALLKKTCVKYKKEKDFVLSSLDQWDEESEHLRVKEKPSWRKKIAAKYRGKFLHKYFLKFKRKNTRENICIKSFLGFLGGVLLTYIYFFFFIFGLRFPLNASTYVCTVCGIIFCLGLAFSRKVRCYVFLMIPVFFSKEGRQVLLSYGIFLSVTGPLKNTVHNMGILADSMTCGQEMIKRALKQIEDMVKAPFRSIKQTIAKIIQNLKDALEKIKAFLNNIKRIILGILHVIKVAVSWLGKIINFCNKKIGTPFQRCMKTFDDAIEDCKAKMGIMDFLCHIVHVVKALCYTVKFLDLICLFQEFVSESVIGVVKRKLKEFGMLVKEMFYVSIEFRHSYEYHMEPTNSTKMVAETILQTLVQKFEKADKFFTMLGWTFSFLFLFIFFRVYYYKYKYMSSDRYDNRYITKHIFELDMRRIKMQKETVLPLELRERKHFCRPTSLRLLREEQQNILSALLIVSLSTFKIVCFIVCDYCLYWVLLTIYKEGHREFAEAQSAEIELHVNGVGPLTEFYRKMGKALKVPKNPDLQLNPIHCLPDPLEPNKDRYIQIGICWVLTVTEAYGLRLRNIVMSHYYPDRAKERAVWLYNHILRSRGTFVKFARRQLRRKIKGGKGDPVEAVTFKERLFATVPILGILFSKKKKACLLCATEGTEKEPLKRCSTPDCPGIYCLKCYAILENVCTLCQHPIEYGDISDISEERDSSEEGYYENEAKKVRPARKKRNSRSTSEEEAITFKDMEIRPKFRDLEKNKVKEFAQKSDLRSSESEESESGRSLAFDPLHLTADEPRVLTNKYKERINTTRRQRKQKMNQRREKIN